MKCIYCGADNPIRAEHCQQCGKKIVVDFDTLAESVHEDAAVARREKLSGYLKWAILALLIIGALIFGINDMFDKPLVYDGSGLPALTVPGSVALDVPEVQKKYVDPRPTPALPEARITAFGYRSSPIKDKLRAANKGDIAPPGLRAPQVAIGEGLRWLSGHQISDGCWPVTIEPLVWTQQNVKEYAWGSVGVTSLVLLAYFGEGETWLGDDPGRKKSQYADRILKGIKFLAQAQDPATGMFRVYNIAQHVFEDGAGGATHFMYNQGMATLAMCEAAGISGDPYLREVAQKGTDYIVKAQTAAGGWNYRGETQGDSDTSLSAWQVQALCAAREIGLKVPPEAYSKALEMYQKATQAEGYVRYLADKEDKEDRNRISLCGVALMMRQLLGDDGRGPTVKKLASVLVEQAKPDYTKPFWGRDWKPEQPKNDDGARAKYDPYLIYFATYGLFFMGGSTWDQWHDAEKKAVIEMQSADGGWHTNDTWTCCGGTSYATALSILTLQVYYRIQSSY